MVRPEKTNRRRQIELSQLSIRLEPPCCPNPACAQYLYSVPLQRDPKQFRAPSAVRLHSDRGGQISVPRSLRFQSVPAPPITRSRLIIEVFAKRILSVHTLV